jgi:cytochrome c peroxidase
MAMKNGSILMWNAAISWSVLLLLAGCTDKTNDTGRTSGFVFDDTSIERLLRHRFDVPVPPSPTNGVADDEGAIRLGHYLFFDAGLSGDGEHSCASCHKPEHGFADTEPFSNAIATTSRNTPTIINSAHNRWFYWDGRCDTLWCQATGPLEAPGEQGSSRLEIAHHIVSDTQILSAYTALFGEPPSLDDTLRFPASGRPIPDDTSDPDHIAWSAMTAEDQESINHIFTNVTKSIGAFERTLIQQNAPFDRMLDAFDEGDRSGGDVLSDSAKRGATLFVGEGLCWACHAGPTFTNKEFHNVALPSLEDFDNQSEGRYSGIDALLSSPFNGIGPYSDAPSDAEIKLAHLVQSPEQIGTFKTPGLRNLLDTAPYMHGGHFETLADVVQHYNEMDDPPLIGHREELLLPLLWTEEQVADVVSFLESLQGAPMDPEWMEQPSSPL